MRRDVYVRLKGPMLEKLIDLALQSGACLSAVRRTDPRSLMIICDAKSAAIVADLCRRYKIDAKTLRFCGLYALLQDIRRRWTLFPALITALAAMLFFLGRIWMIDISLVGPNASSGDAEKLHSLIAEAGIRPGISSSEIDSGAIEKQLLAQSGDYSFIGLRVQGVRLLVEASPELPSPELYDIGSARDLVAARDGVIERIDVHSGTACVNAGDTVRRGQVLILGEEQKSSESSAAVSALGEVYARCWYEGSAAAPRNASVHMRTGNIRVSNMLRLFSKRIPLKQSDPFPLEECETNVLPLVGLYLPVEIETHRHFEVLVKDIPSDENAVLRQMETLARADALSKIDIPENKYSILKSWTEKNINNHTLGVRAVYEISTDIAVSRDELAKEDY